VYGDQYLKAVIKEIYPGPGREINLDVFESPSASTLIQRYELMDGAEVNRLPKKDRIMMRYWTLIPGRHKAAVCAFNNLASTFVNAVKKATEEMNPESKQFLHKLNDPGNALLKDNEDNLDADLDFLNDNNSKSLSSTPMLNRKQQLKNSNSEHESSLSPLNFTSKQGKETSLSPLNTIGRKLSPLNTRKNKKYCTTDMSKEINSSIKKKSSIKRTRKLKSRGDSLRNMEESPLNKKKKLRVNKSSVKKKKLKKVKDSKCTKKQLSIKG